MLGKRSVWAHNEHKSPIVILFPNLYLFYIYKHVQFNTIICKQKGKRVEPHVLKRIYGPPHVTQSVVTMTTWNINDIILYINADNFLYIKGITEIKRKLLQ